MHATRGIVLEKSSNNGGSGSAVAVAVSPLFSGGLADKPWLQIDTAPGSPHANALYISVTQFDSSSNSQISVSHSHDGGTTWTRVAADTRQILPDVDQFGDVRPGNDRTVDPHWRRCTGNG